jgi:MYXO-CTERM domain-containing protein
MQVWAPVMLSCAALLIVSAVPKITHPGPTITALRAVGAGWVGPGQVRLLSAVEIVAGGFAIVSGGRWADAAVAALYLGFSMFLARALRTPAASCGCAGRDDTPPSVAHLVMTAMFALAAVAAIVAGGQTGVLTLTRHAGVAPAAVALGFALTTTWLGWSILTLASPMPSHRST